MDEKTTLPDEEWAFKKLMEEQLLTVELNAKECAEEWERCHKWEFTKERLRSGEHEEFIESLRARRELDRKTRDKIETFEGMPKETEFREEEFQRKRKDLCVQDVFFPYYVTAWPNTPYLAIPIQERLKFKELKHGQKESPDSELAFWEPGKKFFEIWIDFSWPESVAKEKFWNWFKFHREMAGGEKQKTTKHGILPKIKGDLNKLGAKRVLDSFRGDFNAANAYTAAKEVHLYKAQNEWLKACKRVRDIIDSEVF